MSECDLSPLFFLLTPQYPFVLGLVMAVVFSTLVCLSRLYTGMHTVLVRLCGQVLWRLFEWYCGHCVNMFLILLIYKIICICNYISHHASALSNYYVRVHVR